MTSPWTLEPRTYAAWNVERTGSTRRITEDGTIRVTEQGNIRIIERFAVTWGIEPPIYSPWTQE